MWKHTHRLNFLIPAAFFLLNLLLKIRFVHYASLALDEPFSVYFAQFSIETLLAELSKGNNAPLFEVILHFWIKLFGISELSVRMPSVIFSSIAVVALFNYCKHNFNLQTAIWACLFFTFSNYQLYFAQEARAYPLFMLLAMLSMNEYTKLSCSRSSKIYHIKYIIINILLLYCHYFGWFILFIQGALQIILKKYLRLGKGNFLIHVFLIGFLNLPMAYIMLIQLGIATKGTWIEGIQNLRPIFYYYDTLLNESRFLYPFITLTLYFSYLVMLPKITINKAVVIGNSIGATVIFLLALYFKLGYLFTLPELVHKIASHSLSTFLVIAFCTYALFQSLYSNKLSIPIKISIAWFGGCLLLMFTLSLQIPIFVDRYLIYFSAAFYIVYVVIVFHSFENRAKYVLGLSVLIMVFSFSMHRSNYRDVKALIKEVKKAEANTNCFIFIHPAPFIFTFTYYYDKSAFSNISSGIPKKDIMETLASKRVFPIENFDELKSRYQGHTDYKIIYVDAGDAFSNVHQEIKWQINDMLANTGTKKDSIAVPAIFNIYTFEPIMR